VEEGLAEEYLQQKADLLFANLHFAVVRELVEQPAFFEKNGPFFPGCCEANTPRSN
jgi:hypothetical protein